MHLKHEHKIYTRDFDSKEIFVDEIENKIEKLKELKEKLNKLIHEEHHGWENTESKEGFIDILEEAKERINSSIEDLYDLKGELK